MITAVLIVVITIILRFVVVELANSYSFWVSLVTPITVIMWVTIAIATVYIIAKVIKEFK